MSKKYVIVMIHHRHKTSELKLIFLHNYNSQFYRPSPINKDIEEVSSTYFHFCLIRYFLIDSVTEINPAFSQFRWIQKKIKSKYDITNGIWNVEIGIP